MRKVNFMSGVNAKLVLAAMALGSFVLTGCEKEEFKVDAPEIKIPVEIPEAADGVAYVNLSATSINGASLTGVKFTNEAGEPLQDSKKYTAAATFKVFASKDGYETAVKTVIVPELQKGAYVVIPVNFILNPVKESAKLDETAPVVSLPEGDPMLEPVSQKPLEGDFRPGKEYIANVPVPTGAYVTAAQKEALLAEVEKLAGPDVETRAALSDEDAANLLTAKGLLRAKVEELLTAPKTKNQEITFTVKEAAKSVTFTVQTNWGTQEIKLTATVADKPYSVKGEQMVAGESTVSAEGENFDVSHSHGHGHGDGNNVGGGDIKK